MRFLIASTVVFFFLLAAVVPLPSKLAFRNSFRVLDDQGALLRAYLTQDEKWRFSADLSRLPNYFVDGLLCLEDKRFWIHPGIDPLAIVRAAFQNLFSGERISGASTITMQLARLLEPKARTLTSKILEAFRSIQLELLYSKREILELYLTYAPYGSNIEGIEAAAWAFFGKAPKALSIEEALYLYLLPQAPSRLRSFNRDHWAQERRRLARRLSECAVPQIALLDQDIPVDFKISRNEFPKLAPHLSDVLLASSSNTDTVATTLSGTLQEAVEQLAERHQKSLLALGVHNLFIIIVENSSGAVKALVGNGDYFGTGDGAMIPAFLTRRSPGSLLKPFLYAYAIDSERLLPTMKLVDTPVRYGDYSPENFSKGYRGLVSAEDALSASLNIPFIKLLASTGVDEFVTFLEHGGMLDHTPGTDLGLSMIVGGIEVSPLDITSLFVALANDGSTKRVHYVPVSSSVTEESIEWLSPAAARLTKAALLKRDRPDFPTRSKFAAEMNHVAWKTGTSQGRKDAWSIGFDSTYTIAVWAGNLDFTSSPHLVGADAAAPIMFELFDMIGRENRVRSGAEDVVDSIVQIDVCSVSGYPAGEFCPHTHLAPAVRGKIPSAKCPFHRQVVVDRKSRLRLHRSCMQGLDPVLTTVLELPPDVIAWSGNRFVNMGGKPPFHHQCRERPVEQSVLKIEYPGNGDKFFLLPSFGMDRYRLELRLTTSSHMDEIACFFDGSPVELGVVVASPVLEAGVGRHVVFCSDVYGASDEVQFRVSKLD